MILDRDKAVLLIEDEPEIRRFLRKTLPQHGYLLLEATTGRDGLAQAASRPPDMILLDLGLPDYDGRDVIKELREWSSIPIIILSARDQEQTKVDALDLGADDYLTKPFGLNELLARMRVVLRHRDRVAGENGEPVFTTGDLKVDFEKRTIYVSDKEVHLSPIEYKLLTVLVRSAGKVMTHRQLLKEVWGPLHLEEAHYLRVYMGHLRNKLETNPANPRYLMTEMGVGYRLRVD
ncbi:MAG TPA: response regulator [Nitrospiria bacterium]|nr:response regulator [Nitrospiria bacterium]